jgi:hypothetical protein
MRFLFRVTRHSAVVRISINTSQGFPYSAHNLLETRQFRPQLGHSAAKPAGVGAASQRWIATGEQSGLQTHIAAPESISLCTRMRS